MTEIYKGTILRLSGSWGSGLATLTVEDERRGLVALHSDNGPLVRALDAAFGDVIDRNHTFDNAAITGKEIFSSSTTSDSASAGSSRSRRRRRN